MKADPNQFSLAILRNPDGEPTVVAIVSGSIQGLAESSDRQRFIYNKLQSAISRWLATGDGLVAWKESVEDFNVGDLAFERLNSNSPLGRCLTEAGISDFAIDIVDIVDPSLWSYDNVIRPATQF